MSESVGKPVSASSIEGHVHEIYPNDLNSHNTVFGGRIMEIADMLGAACAKMHSNHTCATIIVDSMRFLSPAKRGEILMFYVSINRTWKTSMEVGVKVVAVGTESTVPRKVLSAFFTFVAIDESRNPTAIVPVIPETDEEKRRFEDADRRRQERIAAQKAKEEQLRLKKSQEEQN